MPAPDALARSQILTDYERDSPNLPQIEDWCEREAKELGGKYQPRQIRRVITEQAELLENQIAGQLTTKAERFAAMCGATHALVIQKLIEKLDCTKPVFNKKTGDFVDAEDNLAQIQACRELNQILGAYKPEEIKIDHTHDVSERYAKLSEGEMKLRIAELAVKYGELTGASGGNGNGSGGTSRAITDGDRGAGGGAGGPRGGARSVVLDDGGDQDRGRAGAGARRGPVQAVPEAEIFPPDPGGPG